MIHLNCRDCHLVGNPKENATAPFVPNYPPATISGYLTAFGAVQFAYSGISTFPTVHADMADRAQFKYAAVASYVILFLIYMPVMAAGILWILFCNSTYGFN